MNTNLPQPKILGGRFMLLLLLGIIGLLSTLLLPLNLPADIELPMSETALRIIGLVQSAVLVLVAVLIGQWAAPKIGLSSPVIDSLVNRRDGQSVWSSLQPQLVPGIVFGIALAFIVGILSSLLLPFLPESFIQAGEASPTPAAVRLLYGGITEEILLRWGVMSLFAWIGWRLLQSGAGLLRAPAAWISILGAALLFGIGHLPAAAALSGEAGLTPALIFYIVSLNSIVGVGTGWLFWKKGLESAMIAHMMFHVVILIGMGLGIGG